MDDHDVGAVAGEQTIDDALRKIVGASMLVARDNDSHPGILTV